MVKYQVLPRLEEESKMAISKVVGLKAAVFFLAFIYLRALGMKLASLPVLHVSLVALFVSVASHPCVNIPGLLGKRPDGSFPLWSIIMFGPFLLFVRIYLLVKKFKRMKRGEPMYTEVHEGLYVGGWPSSFDLLPPGVPAVIDCTCELPRDTSLSNNAYMCVAAWDTRSPQPSDIECAVRWACRKRQEKKPVYIHCASGHGRSVCVMCAVLVAVGVAEDWKMAEKIICEKRPHIRMNSLQRRNLDSWWKYHLLIKESGKVDSSPAQ